MTITRDPAVAGLFYPADPAELNGMIDQFLASCPEPDAEPKALIVPHAGYIYSGSTAAAAYKTLRKLRGKIQNVVLLGPSHHVAFRGVAYSKAEQFLTPLGAVVQNQSMIEQITDLPFVTHNEAAHRQEHSLEVQLPFLQRCLDQFTLIPLVVGDASIEQVSDILEQLWGGEETLIVISTDLSHYHPYQEATMIDQMTSHAIEKLDSHHIAPQQACGWIPLLALLETAKRHNLKVTTLELCNSGDTAGSHDRVVGYGAYALQ